MEVLLKKKSYDSLHFLQFYAVFHSLILLRLLLVFYVVAPG